MDGSGIGEWWVRRAVLTVLLVVGVVTTVFAVVATRSEAPQEAREDGPLGVVTEFVPSVAPSDGPLRLDRVLVAARHGAPVEIPANTAESFAAALEGGVDYVEAEVVMTRDGQLLVQADNELSETTDVAEREEFADLQDTKELDGVETTGWFSEDFTLDELRSLNAFEPEPEQRPVSAEQDGEYSLISFDDLVEQVAASNTETGREVGIFVQPRRAAYFRGLGLPIEPAVAKSLRRARLINEPGRVTIESPDLAVLRRLEGNLGDNVLSALVVEADSADLLETDRLAGLPDTIDLLSVEVGAFAGQAVELPGRVHDAGFAIAVYPISYENLLLAPSYREGSEPQGRGDLTSQVRDLADLGIDVILAESPVEVVESLAEIAADASDSPTPDN